MAQRSTHDTGVLAVNVTHWKARNSGSGVDDASAQQVVDALVTALDTKYRTFLPNKWTVNDYTITQVVDPGSATIPEQGVHTVATRGSVSVSGSQISLPQTVLVSLKSNAAVKGGVGRVSLPNPGMVSYLATDGSYDTASLFWTTQLPAYCSALITDVHVTSGVTVDQQCSLVVYSHTRHAKGDPDFYFDVIAATPRTRAHWLRSRTTAP